MDVLSSLWLGFGVALQPTNLLFCFVGVFIGTLIGVLPGIGPVAAMSLLLPITFNITPEAGIIMLAGIYYGSMYGGSTTSILVNIPGEAASVITCLDGYQMARQGRAGPALGMAAMGSFIAGTFAVIGLMLLAPTVAAFAVKFGPSEYFSLMVLGHTFDRAMAEAFRGLGEALFQRVGQEGRNYRAATRQNTQEETQHGAARDRAGAALPVLLRRHQAVHLGLEHLPVQLSFDVVEDLGDAEQAHDDGHQAEAVQQL